jgi:hypothetical protein
MLFNQSSKVHQAPHISTRKRFDLRFANAPQFFQADFAAEISLTDGECAPEPAALIRILERHQPQVWNHLQQPLLRILQPQNAAMTCAMKRHALRKRVFCGPRFDFQNVEHKLRQFKHVGHSLSKQTAASIAKHGRARTARNNHRNIFRKQFDRSRSEFPRRFPIAIVERRLAAAGLISRKLHLAPQTLQDFYGRDADLTVKGVAQASQH